MNGGLPMLIGQLLYQLELEEDPGFKLPKNNWSICIPFLFHGMIYRIAQNFGEVKL